MAENNKYNWQNIGLFLLIPFANICMHKGIPLPPTIIGLFIAMLCALSLYDKNICNTPLSLDKNQWRVFMPVLVFVAYVFISQFIINVPIRRLIGVIGSAMYFPVLIVLANGLNLKNLSKKIDLFLIISLAFFIIEAIWRLSSAYYLESIGENLYNGIYKYKFTSPFFADSNVTGIHLIILLFFSLWWFKDRKDLCGLSIKTKYLIIGVICVLIGLTVSRACYLACILGLIYFFVPKPKPKHIYIGIVGIFILAFLSILALLSSSLGSDLSFISKFEILNRSVEYFKSAEICQLLFGLGISNSNIAIGCYAQNYLLVFALETGLIGAILLIAMLLYFIINTKASALIILIPFIIATSSSSVTFLPDLYVCMGVMVVACLKKS